MEDSKTNLEAETQEVGLKKKLQSSHSDKVETGAPGSQPMSPQSNAAAAEVPIDTTNLHLSKENSEAGMPIENEVIEE